MVLRSCPIVEHCSAHVVFRPPIDMAIIAVVTAPAYGSYFESASGMMTRSAFSKANLQIFSIHSRQNELSSNCIVGCEDVPGYWFLVAVTAIAPAPPPPPLPRRRALHVAGELFSVRLVSGCPCWSQRALTFDRLPMSLRKLEFYVA
ncbi:hypothetical protein EVAR_5432_1 [Eumeta japonica]|uniref:Uncharacterized protein n=1 Tax=Eumeta variegata TaxID=151549 RepID=A0A4C1T9N8_EUMVA|nr:hypothetical protein EVAR_5432_1 [Eumeta japonica]